MVTADEVAVVGIPAVELALTVEERSDRKVSKELHNYFKRLGEIHTRTANCLVI